MTPELMEISLQISLIGTLLALLSIVGFATATTLLYGLYKLGGNMLGRSKKRPFGKLIKLDWRKKGLDAVELQYEEIVS